jgi:hypothetical protein
MYAFPVVVEIAWGAEPRRMHAVHGHPGIVDRFMHRIYRFDHTTPTNFMQDSPSLAAARHSGEST